MAALVASPVSAIPSTVQTVLAVFAAAFVVELVVHRVSWLPYSVTLVLVGLLAAVLGVPPGVHLSHDLVMVVLLPTLLFTGAVELDLDALADVPLVPVVLVLVGLPASVALLGALGATALGLPLLVSFLFAAIVLPTDPAAVLSVFEDLDAPEHLSVMVEGESLFNDGVAIVIFTAMLGLVQAGPADPAAALAAPVRLALLGADLLVVGGGGLLVGFVVGVASHRVTRGLDDRRATLLFTVAVAYGSFLLADHHLGLSGVLATVGAGLAMGRSGEEFTERTEGVEFMHNVWDAAAFLVNTFLYLLIGLEFRPAFFLDHAALVFGGIVLVFAVRAVVVYPLLAAVDRATDEPIDTAFRVVMVWGGLHTVVPVALVVGLPPGVPHRESIRSLVFGIAVLSTLLQGLLMPVVLKRSGAAA